MICRMLQLLAAVTIVVLGPSAGCAYGGQQEVGGSKNTGNDQQEQDEDTNGQHQADCAADRRSQQPFVLSYNNDIWTMSINGSDLAPVTATGEHEGYEIVESEPAWSPDHKR